MTVIGWKAYARREPHKNGFSLWLSKYGGEFDYDITGLEVAKKTRHGEPLPMVPCEDAEGFMQAILDAAWEAGLRPEGFADHKNELTAVRYHLEDMRKLAKVKS